MFCTGVDFQLLRHLASKRSLRQHADNRMTNGALRLFSNQLTVLCFLQSAGLSAVMVVNLLIQLFTGQNDFGSVHNDDIVTGIHIGGVNGLVLAAQDIRNLAGQTSEHHSLCIYDIPFTVDVCSLRNISLQWNFLPVQWSFPS